MGSGAAAIGAVLFGVTGAIVGSAMARENVEMVSSLAIRLTLNRVSDPSDTIQFVRKSAPPLLRDSAEYKRIAEDCGRVASLLRLLSTRNQSGREAAGQPFSVADELLKLKSLMDTGLLTREEFDAQKKKLLAL